MSKWIDLYDPDEDHKKNASQAIGSMIPNRIDLEAIDKTSKFAIKDGNIYLTVPILVLDDDAEGFSIFPFCFILSDDHCVTVRFTDSEAIDNARFHIKPNMTRNQIMSTIIESFIEKLYDNVDLLDQKMVTVSQTIFNYEYQPKEEVSQRQILKNLGKINDHYSAVKKSVDGFIRALEYLGHCQIFEIDDDSDINNFEYMNENLVSISDACGDQINKVAFLLDSILGFINIDQTNSARILAMVSTMVTIPTLIAGVYGMNFDYMPELHQHYGYFSVLGIILISIVLFSVYFWKNNWFKNL